MKKFLLMVVLPLMLVVGSAHGRELSPYPGGATPPLALNDLDGNSHKLENYRGKVVLINFWATWCPPCRAEMPSMQRLKEAMAGKPFVILSVDMGETESDVKEFLKNVKVDFPILMDKDGKALKAWKVFAFPTSYVIDAKGKIRYGLHGSTEWDGADAMNKIKGLLPQEQK
jgi:thiol-disulfide isomerase/thioredoxin